MITDCVSHSPFIWRHMETVHLNGFLANGCFDFNISMVFSSISFKAINVKPWMISGAIYDLYKFYKLFITSNTQSHFLVSTNNSLTQIANVLCCSIALDDLFDTVAENNIKFYLLPKNTSNVSLE